MHKLQEGEALASVSLVALSPMTAFSLKEPLEKKVLFVWIFFQFLCRFLSSAVLPYMKRSAFISAVPHGQGVA